MIDPHVPYTPPRLTAKLRHACARAAAQVGPLAEIVAPLAKARPDAPVPADVLEQARAALRAVVPIASALHAPAPLPLHPPVTFAGLAARLALAEHLTTTFRRRHFVPDTRLEAITWHVEDMTLALARDGSDSGAGGAAW